MHLDRWWRSRPDSLHPRPGPVTPEIVPRIRGAFGPLASEVVLESDDVVELRSRHLDELASLDRLVPMDASGRDPRGLAGTQLVLADDALVVLEVQTQPPGSGRRSISSLISWRWSDSRLPVSMTRTLPT